jgi:hypothetical protein
VSTSYHYGVVDDLAKVVIKVLDRGGEGERCYGKHGSISGKENGSPNTGRPIFQRRRINLTDVQEPLQ